MKETTLWKCDICGTLTSPDIRIRLPLSLKTGLKRCIAGKLNMPAGRLPADTGH